MGRFDDLYNARHQLVLDGAMGTELQRRGYDLNDDLWSARLLRDDPGAIQAVHLDYMRAGADIVTGASYQASVPGFLRAGWTEAEAEALLARSMALVFSARRRFLEERGADKGSPDVRSLPLAAGDIGPYGAFLANGSEYTGDYRLKRSQYRAFHLRRMQILKEAGAEFFAVETIPRLDEAEVCADLLEDLACDYWISFSFRNEREISDGTDLKTVCVNCVMPALAAAVIRGFRENTDLPVCAYPNSGELYDKRKKILLPPEDGLCFQDRIQAWLDAGATILGGCCWTRPDDIRAEAGLVRRRRLAERGNVL